MLFSWKFLSFLGSSQRRYCCSKAIINITSIRQKRIPTPLKQWPMKNISQQAELTNMMMHNIIKRVKVPKDNLINILPPGFFIFYWCAGFRLSPIIGKSSFKIKSPGRLLRGI
ncbi:MAG: hypothetical protein WC514_01470 [Candidatus Paceibacterota bacterium]